MENIIGGLIKDIIETISSFGVVTEDLNALASILLRNVIIVKNQLL